MLAFWDRLPTRFAGARGRRGEPTHLGLRHDTAGRDGLTAHSLAGACGWEDTNVVASANWSMNISRARSRRGATTLLRRSEAPAIGRARGKPDKKIENARRRTHRTWRGRRRTRKWAPGRAWRQPAFSLDRRGTRCVLRADGIWCFGAVPHPVVFEGEGKKNWIIQSSWHAQSYPSLSPGFRGGSRPLIWRADKKRVQETQETV